LKRNHLATLVALQIFTTLALQLTIVGETQFTIGSGYERLALRTCHIFPEHSLAETKTFNFKRLLLIFL
jgi:hypothetical protein